MNEALLVEIIFLQLFPDEYGHSGVFVAKFDDSTNFALYGLNY